MKPPKDFAISPFTIDSYDDVFALWRECEGVGLSDADSRDSIGRYLERNPGMSFVARVDGTVVGAVLAGHDGRRGYIHHLAVRQASRRHGLGRLLAGASLDTLRKAGIRKCHLFIFNTNAVGIAFWQSQDWTLRKDVSLISKDLDCKL